MRRLSVCVFLLVLCIAALSAESRSPNRQVDQDRPAELRDVSFNVERFEPTRDAVVATGSVLVHQYFDLTEDEVEQLEAETPEFFNTLALDGMERVGNRLQRTFSVSNDVTLRFNDAEIELAGERFAFVMPKATAKDARARLARDPRLDVKVHDEAVPSDQFKAVLRNGLSRRPDEPLVIDVVFSVDMREAAPMCHLHGEDEGGSRKIEAHAPAPMEGTCLDYNGRYSDGINHSNKSAKGIRNYIGSDCFIAMDRGHCWTEFVTKKSCFNTHGGKICSVLIGHSTKYHKH